MLTTTTGESASRSAPTMRRSMNERLYGGSDAATTMKMQSTFAHTMWPRSRSCPRRSTVRPARIPHLLDHPRGAQGGLPPRPRRSLMPRCPGSPAPSRRPQGEHRPCATDTAAGAEAALKHPRRATVDPGALRHRTETYPGDRAGKGAIKSHSRDEQVHVSGCTGVSAASRRSASAAARAFSTPALISNRSAALLETLPHQAREDKPLGGAPHPNRERRMPDGSGAESWRNAAGHRGSCAPPPWLPRVAIPPPAGPVWTRSAACWSAWTTPPT